MAKKKKNKTPIAHSNLTNAEEKDSLKDLNMFIPSVKKQKKNR